MIQKHRIDLPTYYRKHISLLSNEQNLSTKKLVVKSEKLAPAETEKAVKPREFNSTIEWAQQCIYSCKVCGEFSSNDRKKHAQHLLKSHNQMTVKSYINRFGSTMSKRVEHDCKICTTKVTHNRDAISSHLSIYHPNTTLPLYFNEYIRGSNPGLENKRRAEESPEEPPSKKIKQQVQVKSENSSPENDSSGEQIESSGRDNKRKADDFSNSSAKKMRPAQEGIKLEATEPSKENRSDNLGMITKQEVPETSNLAEDLLENASWSNNKHCPVTTKSFLQPNKMSTLIKAENVNGFEMEQGPEEAIEPMDPFEPMEPMEFTEPIEPLEDLEVEPVAGMKIEITDVHSLAQEKTAADAQWVTFEIGALF